MKKTWKLLLAATAISLSFAVVWALLGPSIITKARFDRVQVGMTFEEVKAILGDPGPSYSSDHRYQYYIWKSKGGWIRIFVRQGRVTERQLDPDLSDVD